MEAQEATNKNLVSAAFDSTRTTSTIRALSSITPAYTTNSSLDKRRASLRISKPQKAFQEAISCHTRHELPRKYKEHGYSLLNETHTLLEQARLWNCQTVGEATSAKHPQSISAASIYPGQQFLDLTTRSSRLVWRMKTRLRGSLIWLDSGGCHCLLLIYIVKDRPSRLHTPGTRTPLSLWPQPSGYIPLNGWWAVDPQLADKVSPTMCRLACSLDLRC